MLICPKCGFEKESARKLEFCPKDGSAMMPRLVRPVSSTPEFRIGLRKMQEKLVPEMELETIGGRETFRVLKVEPMRVVIAPTLSMKERPISVSEIEAIYQRWLESGRSYASSDYQSRTVNSVYILRFIKEFWDVQSE